MFLEALLVFVVVFLLVILLLTLPIPLINLRPKLIWKMAKLPGPTLIGMAHILARLRDTNTIEFWKDCYSKYPRICAMWAFGCPYAMVFDPDDVEVLLGSSQLIQKGFEYNLIYPWLQEGLLLSCGEKWHRRRKILTPAFHFKTLENSMKSLNKQARYLLQNMLKKGDKPFVVEELIAACTLEVICESAMGYSLNLQKDDTGNDVYLKAVRSTCVLVLERFLKAYYSNDWLYSLSNSGRKFFNNLNYLHGFTEKIIQERKKNYLAAQEEISPEKPHLEDEEFVKKKKAFLDILIEMDKKTGHLLTDKEIREEVDTFMFEGHDTTSSALVHTVYLLGKHPEIQEKAYEELYEIFGEDDRAVTNRDLAKMHYLEMIIKESLRMYPPVPYMTRMLTQDLVLKDNVIIPEGTNVSMLPIIQHRNPKHFPNPDVFDPERFTVENCKKRHPYAYIPFSAGPRNCIGQKFAKLELKTVLSTIIRFSKIESVNNIDDCKLIPILVLRTKYPILIKVTPRTS